MRTFGKVLRTTTHWKQDVYQFLLNYRATPVCTTVVAPPTTFVGRPVRTMSPNPVVVPIVESHDSVSMHKRDAQLKLRIKIQFNLIDSRRAFKDCDIQVEPQYKSDNQSEKSCQRHITRTRHSMLTAKSADRKVTSNSSHFKKFLADDSTKFRTSQLLEGDATDLETESSPLSRSPISVQEPTESPVEPLGEVLRSWLNLCVQGLHLYLYPQRRIKET